MLLDLKEIITDPAFDIREERLNQGQVDALVQAMRHGAKPPPPVVWLDPADGKYRMIDGWQRLAAFKHLNPRSKAVTVKSLGPTFNRSAAVLEAVMRRSVSSLPLSPAERLQAAWGLVLTSAADGKPWAYSRTETAKACGIGSQTVANMRQRLLALREADREPTGTWWKDRKDSEGDRQEMTDKEEAAFRADVAAAVNKVLIGFRKKNDQALMEGIAEGLGAKLTGAFISYVGGAADEAFDDRWTGADPADEAEDEAALHAF